MNLKQARGNEAATISDKFLGGKRIRDQTGARPEPNRQEWSQGCTGNSCSVQFMSGAGRREPQKIERRRKNKCLQSQNQDKGCRSRRSFLA